MASNLEQKVILLDGSVRTTSRYYDLCFQSEFHIHDGLAIGKSVIEVVSYTTGTYHCTTTGVSHVSIKIRHMVWNSQLRRITMMTTISIVNEVYI